jgi:hypothetical protein
VAGFGDEGTPLIVDTSLGVHPERLADALRAEGINARSVKEVFGRTKIEDRLIRETAEAVHGRVVASDRGRILGEGFGPEAITVANRVKRIEDVVRLVRQALEETK